jgi:hypothetical protein
MANTFELIASSTVGSGGAASIEFTSIPATYTDLCLKLSGRTSSTGSIYEWVYIKFNSSTTGYSYRLLQGNGSSAASYNNTTQYAGDITDGTATASTFGNYEVYIPNYAGSTNKSFSVDAVTENNGTTAVADLVAGLWSNSAAITAVNFTPRNGSFVQYSTAYLYGVKNA